MKKKPDPPKSFPLWQSTFSDLMNLLLCFFVLLFSMSSINEDKYQMVVNSLQTAFTSIMASGGNSIVAGSMVSSGISQLPDFSNYFGTSFSKGDANGETDTGTVPMTDDASKDTNPDADSTSDTTETAKDTGQDNDKDAAGKSDTSETDETKDAGKTDTSETDATDSANVSVTDAEEKLNQAAYEESEQMAEDIQQAAQQYGIQDLIQVDYNGDFVKITLSGALLFDSGSATLRDEAKPLVQKLAKILEAYPSNLIDIEGHTDNVPIHSSKFESNDVLSMYRALNVTNLIRENSVLDPSHIISTGRGDYSPVADNSTPEGRARNRRVEIKVYNSYNSDSIQSSN